MRVARPGSLSRRSTRSRSACCRSLASGCKVRPGPHQHPRPCPRQAVRSGGRICIRPARPTAPDIHHSDKSVARSVDYPCDAFPRLSRAPSRPVCGVRRSLTGASNNRTSSTGQEGGCCTAARICPHVQLRRRMHTYFRTGLRTAFPSRTPTTKSTGFPCFCCSRTNESRRLRASAS